MTSFKI